MVVESEPVANFMNCHLSQVPVGVGPAQDRVAVQPDAVYVLFGELCRGNTAVMIRGVEEINIEGRVIPLVEAPEPVVRHDAIEWKLIRGKDARCPVYTLEPEGNLGRFEPTVQHLDLLGHIIVLSHLSSAGFRRVSCQRPRSREGKEEHKICKDD